MAGDDVKLPLFHGNGIEDPEQYWFLCEAIWIVKKLLDEDIKKVQLEITFRGHALDWYMKFMQFPTQNLMNTLSEIRTRLIKEFRKPKFESQYIMKLKEIKNYPNESVQDFNQ